LRLGILGGTFNPIHFGHLRIAEEICEELDLDKVLLIPGSLPPHKDNTKLTPFHHRLAMTRMAAESSPLLEVLDLEGRRAGLSYSIETLREIHRIYDPGLELFFIIGMDAFQEIKTWKEYKHLFRDANFVVIKRPGLSFDRLRPFILSLDVGFQEGKDINTFVVPSGNLLIYKETTMLGISSTAIREMVGRGRSIRFLVPDRVRSYILEKGLY
jgi:nicotinate-nucleotide adenylyltransferase